jgi:acylpyruvate hydrolase
MSSLLAYRWQHTDAALTEQLAYEREGTRATVEPGHTASITASSDLDLFRFSEPEHPTLFAKYSRSLVGAYDDIVLPRVSEAVDWEAELGVVIGSPVRHATAEHARAAIAGYTVVNDITGRDWQYRTQQWLQGKTFEASTPVGPWLVTDIEASGRAISCLVDDETVQSADTADLIFDPVALIRYISSVITLVPGDLIATGTPGGVGHARKPPRYLEPGQTVVTRINGIGECRNTCRAARVTSPA